MTARNLIFLLPFSLSLTACFYGPQVAPQPGNPGTYAPGQPQPRFGQNGQDPRSAQGTSGGPLYKPGSTSSQGNTVPNQSGTVYQNPTTSPDGGSVVDLNPTAGTEGLSGANTTVPDTGSATTGTTNTDPAPTTTGAPSAGHPFGVPVPGKQGMVYSPYARDKGWVDVRDIAPGTKVTDPYTGKIFLVP